MSVFKINPRIVDFDLKKNHHLKIPKELSNPILHQADVDALISKIKSDKGAGFQYGGGRIFAAEINCSCAEKDYSYIHIAFPLGRPTSLLDAPDDWAILLCPLGNIKNNNRPSICPDDDTLCRSLFHDCNLNKEVSPKPVPLASIVRALLELKKGSNIDTKDIIEEGKHRIESGDFDSLTLPLLMPSNTSLIRDFTEAGFKSPSIEELNSIFFHK